MNPKHIRSAHRKLDLPQRKGLPVLHVIAAGGIEFDTQAKRSQERWEDDLFCRPDARLLEDFLQLNILEHLNERPGSIAGEHGGWPERPVHELLLPTRETSQERTPQLEFAPSLRSRRDPRGTRLLL